MNEIENADYRASVASMRDLGYKPIYAVEEDLDCVEILFLPLSDVGKVVNMPTSVIRSLREVFAEFKKEQSGVLSDEVLKTYLDAIRTILTSNIDYRRVKDEKAEK